MKQRLLSSLLLGVLLAACQTSLPNAGKSPLPTPLPPDTVITCTLESAQNHLDIGIDALRVTDEYILALTQNGLYRTARDEKRWSYLQCPNNFPQQGHFANHTQSSDPPILISAQGLFSTSDNGSTWHLVSNAYRFSEAFLHPDGTLYAIATITISCQEPIRDIKGVFNFLSGESASRTCLRNIVVMSSDFGHSWQDITGNISDGVSLNRVSQDPDHPDLVVLHGASNIRPYILQALDKRYDWQIYAALTWHQKHPSYGRDFFAKDYATQTIAYVWPATLANYFDYDFGEQTHLPGFDISTDQATYTFAPTDKKIITATIKFLPLTDSDRLIDLQDSADLWGVRILDSSDHRVNQTAKLTQLTSSSADQEAVVQQYRNKPDFHRITISRTQPYTKSIDLNEIYNLVIPGTYQMQLIYDNESIGIWGSGEWIGFFAGNVFTVTVTAP